MKQTFFGGIVFPTKVEGKAPAASRPLEEYTPSVLVLSMRQGFGGECEPTVSPGDPVLVGSAVGRSQDGFAPPIHAGVSGTVLAVEPRPTADGDEVTAVVIENDRRNTSAPPLPALTVHEPPKKWRERMREAGLIGMGGAGFPTDRKYSGKPVDTVLVNGCECEPYLTCDHRIMLERTERVIEGALALGRAAGVGRDRVFLCVEKNKPDAIERLTRAAGNRVRIVALPTRYPQGGERQLIQAVLGREVPMGGLPADVGAVVSNVSTAAAMGDAAVGIVLTHRAVTVAGEVARPLNLYVPIGTLFSELLEAAGGERSSGNLPPPFWEKGAPRRLIAGGPMTGRLLASADVPVTKGSAGLVVLPPQSFEEQNCIRCGACARVCPSRLMPFAIDAAVVAGKMEVCADYGAVQCISCGCCSFICPARRSLATRVSLSRNTLRRRMAAAPSPKE